MTAIARRALACAALVASAVPAPADARPSSLSMTCGQAAQLVRQRGALVLGTGGQTFDRYVRDRSFCEPTEIARRAFAPTRDDPACLVGYTCYEPSGDDYIEDF